MKRATKASALLVLVCAQAAFANPVGQWFMKSGPDCGAYCKPGTTPAVYGQATVACPEGFAAEKDPLGILRCVRRTKGACPSGTTATADGMCAPADSQCLPTVAGLCPTGWVTKTNCTNVNVVLPSIGKGAAGNATAAAPGRKLLALHDMFAPAVEVNAEHVTPLVVLPKPILSMNVPEFYAEVDGSKLPKHQHPLIILPQPALSFIEPKINVITDKGKLPKHDIVVPILPQPKIAFIPPTLDTIHGGLNINKKLVVIDATRTGPKKTYEVNIPPVRVPNLHPVKVDYLPPPRSVVDLSRYGPRDATVVQLPDITINASHPVKHVSDPRQIRFVDLGRAQKGPIYEFALPNLPQKNKVIITLPKVNMSTIVLPGHAEKEVVAVNLQAPDYPPTHQLHVTVDASNATFLGLPRHVKVQPNGGWNDTRVQIVTLPPININGPGPIVTIDKRKNKTDVGDRVTQVVTGFIGNSSKDLEVVQVKLPTIPRMGRDVNISMGTINVDNYNPVRAQAGDIGQLKTTVSLINATLPSMNHIPALNKPFFKPGDVTVRFDNNGTGKGAWALQVRYEDTLSGGKGEATPLKIGAPLAKDSVFNVIRDAVHDAIPSNINGQYCKYHCCPAPKAAPVTIEYAEPVFKCAEGCSYDGNAAKCVCAAAKEMACPAGKKLCSLPHMSTGLCVDASAHDKLCVAHAVVCQAQNKVAACSA